MISDKQSFFFTADIPYFKNYSSCLLQCSNIRNIIKHCLLLLHCYLLTRPNELCRSGEYGKPRCLIASSSKLCFILVFATVLFLGTIKVMFKIKLKWIVSLKPTSAPLPPQSTTAGLGPPRLSYSPFNKNVDLKQVWMAVKKFVNTVVNGKLTLTVGNPSCIKLKLLLQPFYL